MPPFYFGNLLQQFCLQWKVSGQITSFETNGGRFKGSARSVRNRKDGGFENIGGNFIKHRKSLPGSRNMRIAKEVVQMTPQCKWGKSNWCYFKWV